MLSLDFDGVLVEDIKLSIRQKIVLFFNPSRMHYYLSKAKVITDNNSLVKIIKEGMKKPIIIITGRCLDDGGMEVLSKQLADFCNKNRIGTPYFSVVGTDVPYTRLHSKLRDNCVLMTKAFVLCKQNPTTYIESNNETVEQLNTLLNNKVAVCIQTL